MTTDRNKAVVVTADLVNSTHFSSRELEMKLTWLTEQLHQAVSWRLSPEVFRGDSFQGVLERVEDALYIAILSRALLKSNGAAWDLRMAVGVGGILRLSDRAGTSDGEAFRLSGQLADTMKKGKARIAVALPVSSEPIDGVLLLLEAVIEKWTAPQAKVIVQLMNGRTMTETADLLKMSQSAVSQHALAAKWWAVGPAIQTFGSLINVFYPYD